MESNTTKLDIRRTTSSSSNQTPASGQGWPTTAQTTAAPTQTPVPSWTPVPPQKQGWPTSSQPLPNWGTSTQSTPQSAPKSAPQPNVQTTSYQAMTPVTFEVREDGKMYNPLNGNVFDPATRRVHGPDGRIIGETDSETSTQRNTDEAYYAKMREQDKLREEEQAKLAQRERERERERERHEREQRRLATEAQLEATRRKLAEKAEKEAREMAVREREEEELRIAIEASEREAIESRVRTQRGVQTQARVQTQSNPGSGPGSGPTSGRSVRPPPRNSSPEPESDEEDEEYWRSQSQSQFQPQHVVPYDNRSRQMSASHGGYGNDSWDALAALTKEQIDQGKKVSIRRREERTEFTENGTPVVYKTETKVTFGGVPQGVRYDSRGTAIAPPSRRPRQIGQ